MRCEFNFRERTFEDASDCGQSGEFNSCISQSEHVVDSTNQIAQPPVRMSLKTEVVYYIRLDSYSCVEMRT